MIGAIIGGLAGGMYSDYRARKEADKNRNFQANMSNTSHVREVNDLRAAGLNPILSANAGASTPSGATAQTSDMGSTALDAMRLKEDIKNIRAQTELATATANRENATAKNLIDSNRGIKAESETKGTLLDKVLQGMGIINSGQSAKKSEPKNDWTDWGQKAKVTQKPIPLNPNK